VLASTSGIRRSSPASADGSSEPLGARVPATISATTLLTPCSHSRKPAPIQEIQSWARRVSGKHEDHDAEHELYAEARARYSTRIALPRRLRQAGRGRAAACGAQQVDASAPNAKVLRDCNEHLDEYLLDRPSKHVKIAGRAAPVLLCQRDSDNVVVRSGSLRST
jgi:hypothetical protein